MQRHSAHKGVVSRISPLRVVFISEPSGETYTFHFNKIRGYRGESPKELGLKPGRTVSFSLSPDHDRILEVELV